MLGQSHAYIGTDRHDVQRRRFLTSNETVNCGFRRFRHSAVSPVPAQFLTDAVSCNLTLLTSKFGLPLQLTNTRQSTCGRPNLLVWPLANIYLCNWDRMCSRWVTSYILVKFWQWSIEVRFLTKEISFFACPKRTKRFWGPNYVEYTAWCVCCRDYEKQGDTSACPSCRNGQEALCSASNAILQLLTICRHRIQTAAIFTWNCQLSDSFLYPLSAQQPPIGPGPPHSRGF